MALLKDEEKVNDIFLSEQAIEAKKQHLAKISSTLRMLTNTIGSDIDILAKNNFNNSWELRWWPGMKSSMRKKGKT